MCSSKLIATGIVPQSAVQFQVHNWNCTTFISLPIFFNVSKVQAARAAPKGPRNYPYIPKFVFKYSPSLLPTPTSLHDCTYLCWWRGHHRLPGGLLDDVRYCSHARRQMWPVGTKALHYGMPLHDLQHSADILFMQHLLQGPRR